MRCFALLPLVFATTQAAILPRQATCDTVTVTPPVVTETQDVNTNVYYTTTTITRLALTSSSTAETTAAPAPSAYKRDDIIEARQESCAATTTLDASTTTVTGHTYTFSQAYRATATAAACQPNDNYGLFNGTLSINRRNGGALPSVQSFPDLSIDQCCAACFTSTGGCMAWSFSGSPNNGAVIEGCSMLTMSSGCPSTSGTEVIKYINNDGEKALVGVGQCLKEVSYFIEG